MGNDWNHQRVYKALVAMGMVTGPFQNRPKKASTRSQAYVRLYPQRYNCAILYEYGAAGDKPVHLKPTRAEWREEVFRRIKPALKLEYTDVRGFDHYSVNSWNHFAEALGLNNS